MLMKKKASLEANKLAKEIVNLYPGKFFSSCYHQWIDQWIHWSKSSMNCVNLCNFVVCFPDSLAISHTPDLLKNLGKKMQPICWCSWLFFSSFELFITMYLRKFAFSGIPSHDDITCFLAHWLGNFSTISMHQISSLSLNTLQDSCNNKCQSIQTVFHSLKIKLSSACMILEVQTNN